MNCEFTASARLAGQGAPATCLSPPPQDWDCECCHTQHFYVGAQDVLHYCLSHFPASGNLSDHRRWPAWNETPQFCCHLSEGRWGGRGAWIQRRCGKHRLHKHYHVISQSPAPVPNGGDRGREERAGLWLGVVLGQANLFPHFCVFEPVPRGKGHGYS